MGGDYLLLCQMLEDAEVDPAVAHHVLGTLIAPQPIVGLVLQLRAVVALNRWDQSISARQSYDAVADDCRTMLSAIERARRQASRELPEHWWQHPARKTKSGNPYDRLYVTKFPIWSALWVVPSELSPRSDAMALRAASLLLARMIKLTDRDLREESYIPAASGDGVEYGYSTSILSTLQIASRMLRGLIGKTLREPEIADLSVLRELDSTIEWCRSAEPGEHHGRDLKTLRQHYGFIEKPSVSWRWRRQPPLVSLTDAARAQLDAVLVLQTASLAPAFRKYYGRRRLHAAVQVTRPRGVITEVPVDPNDDDGNAEALTVIRPRSPNPDWDDDVAPGEEITDDERIYLYFPDLDEREPDEDSEEDDEEGPREEESEDPEAPEFHRKRNCPPVGVIAARAVARRRQEQRRSQLLPSDYSQATDHEARWLLARIDQIVEAVHATSDPHAIVSAARLLALLAVGQSLTDTAGFAISPRWPDFIAPLPRCTYVADEQLWILKTHGPELKSSTLGDKATVRASQNWVKLRDVFGFARLAEPLLRVSQEYGVHAIPSAERGDGSTPSAIRFPAQERAIRRDLLRTLGDVPSDIRVTPARIRNMLANRMRLLTGDLVAGKLLFNDVSRDADTIAHYETPRAEALGFAYTLTAESFTQGRRPSFRPWRRTTYSDRFTGHPYCPSSGAISRWLATTREAFQRSPPKDKEQFRFIHNAYTCYAVAIHLIATAGRGVTDPAPEFLDTSSGIASILDKNRSNGHTRRTLIVASPGATQFDQYEQHREYVVHRAFEREQVEELPWYFLISAKWTPVPIGPKTLSAVQGAAANDNDSVNEYGIEPMPFPMNAFRRYVRIFLAESGANADVLDPFMGHWVDGAEPWTTWSSFCVEDLRPVSEMLAAHMKELGWLPLPSPLIQ